MFLFFHNKSSFQNFTHELVIKITGNDLTAAFHFGSKLNSDKNYQNIMNDYLKYNLLMSCLISLQGQFVAADITPFDLIKNLEQVEGSSSLVEKIFKFQFPTNYKMYMIDYPDEKQQYIKTCLTKISNGDKIDLIFVNYEIMQSIFSSVKK